MIKYQGDKTDATALAAYAQSLEDRLDFADFEWNRATAGMQERDAEITRLQEAKRRALQIADERAKEANALMMALKSASIQCGNVIYNCEQQPADNQRHLDSWCNVKAFIDMAIRNAVVKQGK